MTTREKLMELIMNYAKVSEQYTIKDEDDMVYDLGMDSLSLVEFIVDIEEQFDIEIEEEEMDEIYKFGKLLSYLEAKEGK
mgnify:CR=1 FL=1